MKEPNDTLELLWKATNILQHSSLFRASGSILIKTLKDLVIYSFKYKPSTPVDG